MHDLFFIPEVISASAANIASRALATSNFLQIIQLLLPATALILIMNLKISLLL